jgi:hypothetical protein
LSKVGRQMLGTLVARLPLWDRDCPLCLRLLPRLSRPLPEGGKTTASEATEISSAKNDQHGTRTSPILGILKPRDLNPDRHERRSMGCRDLDANRWQPTRNGVESRASAQGDVGTAAPRCRRARRDQRHTRAGRWRASAPPSAGREWEKGCREQKNIKPTIDRFHGQLAASAPANAGTRRCHWRSSASPGTPPSKALVKGA